MRTRRTRTTSDIGWLRNLPNVWPFGRKVMVGLLHLTVHNYRTSYHPTFFSTSSSLEPVESGKLEPLDDCATYRKSGPSDEKSIGLLHPTVHNSRTSYHPTFFSTSSSLIFFSTSILDDRSNFVLSIIFVSSTSTLPSRPLHRTLLHSTFWVFTCFLLPFVHSFFNIYLK